MLSADLVARIYTGPRGVPPTQPRRGALDSVGDAVAVRVGVGVVGRAVAVCVVDVRLVLIGDAVAVRVDSALLGVESTVAVCVGRRWGWQLRAAGRWGRAGRLGEADGGGQGASESRRRSGSATGSATRSIDDASTTTLAFALSRDAGSSFAALNLENANSVAWTLATS